MSATKSDLKVVKNKKTDEIQVVEPGKEPKPKKLTKAEKKKIEKQQREFAKKQEEEQIKAMEVQIKNMHEKVSASKCNDCKHCLNPNKTFDRFKVKSSKGDELFCPMNFCTLAGLSLVDVEECEKFDKRES